MNIFEYSDIIYEIYSHLNYIEKLKSSTICHGFYKLTNQLNVEKELFSYYTICTQMESYNISSLPFVNNFVTILYNKYDLLENETVKIKINHLTAFIYKNGSIALIVKGRLNDNDISQLYNQLYDNGILLYKMNYNNITLITKTCTLKLHNLNKDIIEKLHYHYSIDERSLHNCKIIRLTSNEFKSSIRYKLFQNGTVQFNYQNFDCFFDTFKKLITLINFYKNFY